LPEYTFSDADYLEGWDFVGSAPPTKNEFDAWFRQVDTKLKWLYDQMQATASKLYPVGSVYISFNATDPSTLFGGVWTRLKDTFLLVNGDQYAPNTTGGSATKTIGVENMPSHNHTVSSSGNHTHPSGNITVSTSGEHTHTINRNGGHYHGAMGENYSQSLYGFYNSARNHVGTNGNLDNDNTIWKTSTDGEHTHTMNSKGNHTHTVNIASSGSHTHTTNNTGGGTPLNIMPPYTTVYAWRRTA
jgi:hypothetical protein